MECEFDAQNKRIQIRTKYQTQKSRFAYRCVDSEE